MWVRKKYAKTLSPDFPLILTGNDIDIVPSQREAWE